MIPLFYKGYGRLRAAQKPKPLRAGSHGRRPKGALGAALIKGCPAQSLGVIRSAAI